MPPSTHPVLVGFCPSRPAPWLHRGPHEARQIPKHLHGRICLVRGNHDKTAETLKSDFAWIKDLYELKVEDEDAPQ